MRTVTTRRLPAGQFQCPDFAIPDGAQTLTVMIEHGGGDVPAFTWDITVGDVPLGGGGTHGPQPRAASGSRRALPPGSNRVARVLLELAAEHPLAVDMTAD